MNWVPQLEEALRKVQLWEDTYEAFDPHPAMEVNETEMAKTIDAYTRRLRGNYPFFHPRYAGQMLKPPHPAAMIGYAAAMRINPNNHALDGGPPTGKMEKEVVRQLANMIHYPEGSLGHLTTSGTLANLEALWVAREIHPTWSIAVSEEAHYTHQRMAQLLGLDVVSIPTDQAGRMDLGALEHALEEEKIGTVVVTAGSTGVGAVDPIADILQLRQRYGCRVHADAAYGGFFAILAWAEQTDDPLLSDEVRRHLRELAVCDSVAIDPHKHGLQPYGCGAVLFFDRSVARLYKHDSPYTYFSSDDLHLGEISLECSRAGAAAGALWMTMRVLPLEADEGLGPILAACRRAALAWHERIEASERVHAFLEPELDILTFLPAVEPLSAKAIHQRSNALFQKAMNSKKEPLFLSLYDVSAEELAEHVEGVQQDRPHAQILRSVLMKPEHELHVDTLHQALLHHLESMEAPAKET